jgi:hypothetical protein
MIYFERLVDYYNIVNINQYFETFDWFLFVRTW